MESQIKRANTVLAIFGLLALVLLAAWVFSIYSIGKTEDRHLGLKGELLEAEANEESVRNLHRELRESESKRLELASYFVNEEEAAEFLETVEVLSARSGLLTEIRAFNKRGEELAMTVETTGSFSNNYHFLSLLETLPYRLFVDKMSLLEGGEGWKMVVDLSVESFKVREE